MRDHLVFSLVVLIYIHIVTLSVENLLWQMDESFNSSFMNKSATVHFLESYLRCVYQLQ